MPGKTIKKPSDSVGEEFMADSFQGPCSATCGVGISELTLFPLGACRVGKDLSDFDELVNC